MDEKKEIKKKIQIDDKEAKRLLSIPGNVKGAVLLMHYEYLRQVGQEEQIEKLKKRLKELNCYLSPKEIKPMEYYSEGLSVLMILLIAEMLELDDEGIFKMGEAAPKISFFAKFLTKYFFLLKNVFTKRPITGINILILANWSQ